MIRNSSSKNNIARAFAKAGPYLNIGYTLLAAVVVLGYVGYRLDEWSELKPLFLIIGVFSGLFFGFYNMFKVIQNINRDQDQ